MIKVFNFIRARFRKFLNEEEWLEDHIKMGMIIGKNCDIHPGLIVDHSHCWLIEVGDNVTIAPQVYLLAHDASTKRYLNYAKIGKIVIKNNAFIGARALIMPGVTIGENAIVAAGSIVNKSVPDGAIVGGNPSKIIGSTKDYISKHEALIKNSPIYDHNWTIRNGITKSMKRQMNTDLENKNGYVI